MNPEEDNNKSLEKNLNISSILYFSLAGEHAMIYLVSGKPILKAFEEFSFMTGDAFSDFFHANSRDFVNLEHIRRYIKGDQPEIELSDGSLVKLDHEKKTDFLNFLNQKL